MHPLQSCLHPPAGLVQYVHQALPRRQDQSFISRRRLIGHAGQSATNARPAHRQPKTLLQHLRVCGPAKAPSACSSGRPRSKPLAPVALPLPPEHRKFAVGAGPERVVHSAGTDRSGCQSDALGYAARSLPDTGPRCAGTPPYRRSAGIAPEPGQRSARPPAGAPGGRRGDRMRPRVYDRVVSGSGWVLLGNEGRLGAWPPAGPLLAVSPTVGSAASAARSLLLAAESLVLALVPVRCPCSAPAYSSTPR